MRELKFRVWNGHSMEHNVTVGKFGNFYVNPENGNGLNPNDSASLTNNTTKYHESTPIMQYTGLKDKNGKEIYEGDILSKPDRLFIASVEFIAPSFSTRVLRNELRNETNVLRFVNELEIIGNIYQNPELLTPPYIGTNK